MLLVTALAFGFDGVTIPLLLSLFAGIESTLIAIKLGQKNLEVKKEG